MGLLLTKTGDVYGSWTVLQAMPKKSWCRCACGVEKLIENGNLRSKRHPFPRCRSCANRNKWKKHRGICSTIPYAIFLRLRTVAENAVSRCTNKDRPDYEDYAGRGIKVCQQWLDNKLDFILHLSTLEGCGDASLELDRIDNDGNYEPGNLRFVTHSESMLNRRKFKTSHDVRGRFASKTQAGG